MSRVACALGTIKPALDRYDEENHVAKTSLTHQEAKNLEDLKAIIDNQDIFEKHTKRTYKTFPKLWDPLHAKSFKNIT